MVEKKKKKWSHILIRWLGSAGACVGGATRLHHPVSALKAAYFRIRRQIFLVSIERNQKQSVDAKWTEGGFKENPMKLVSLQRVPT